MHMVRVPECDYPAPSWQGLVVNRARGAVHGARQKYEDSPKQAERALKDAAESLSRYEKSGGKHQDEARTIRDEMAALSKELAQEKQGPMDKVKEKLMGWWDRVRSWESRHL